MHPERSLTDWARLRPATWPCCGRAVQWRAEHPVRCQCQPPGFSYGHEYYELTPADQLYAWLVFGMVITAIWCEPNGKVIELF